MPIYSMAFTVPALSKSEFELVVEGDVITYVRIRFPPGSQGLLKVAVFYGLKQIFPCEEGTFFVGDDEIIEWEEYFELPESPCRLIVKAENEDDTYSHSFYVVMNVQSKKDTLAVQISKQIMGAFKALFGRA